MCCVLGDWLRGKLPKTLHNFTMTQQTLRVCLDMYTRCSSVLQNTSTVPVELPPETGSQTWEKQFSPDEDVQETGSDTWEKQFSTDELDNDDDDDDDDEETGSQT